MKTFVLLISILLASSAAAQMKSWTDEDGVVHYEARGSASPVETSAPKPGHGGARIERSYGGLSLGDHVSSFRASGKGQFVRRDEQGGDVFVLLSKYRTAGALKVELLFVNDRLALISTTYPARLLGGWNKFVEDTTAAHGKPGKMEDERFGWNDGEVSLVIENHRDLAKNELGLISAHVGYASMVGDHETKLKPEKPKF